MDGRRLFVGIDGRELAGRPTGTGRYLRSLLRHWRDGNDELSVYFNGPVPDEPVLDHPSIRSRAVAGGAHGLLWEQRLLPAAAAKDRLDVFFSPAYSCPLWLDVPRVTTIHDLSFFAVPHDFAFHDGLRRRLLVRLSMKASRALVVCAEFTRREVAMLFPELAARVTVIPHGSDDDLRPPPTRDEARARLSVRGPMVLTVGSVLNRRCLPELLRAVAMLRRTRPGLLLDVAGENRTHPAIDFDALVSQLGLGGQVRLSGFVDEQGLADRYAAADVAVFLSEYEGFGMGALEAASRGVPLVVSRAPSLGEIFAEAALLVDPHDERATAEAIDRVLRDRRLRERLVAAGHALAARHSWKEAAARTRAVLADAARP